MSDSPEARARQNIDDLLTAAGWVIQDSGAINPYASRGIAVREFPLLPGHGAADYLLYIDRQPAGVIEAKKEGAPLTGYEIQTEKYSTGLPPELNPPRSPLPFLYQSTGVESRFTNLLDPEPRSRRVFAFHKPETLAAWLAADLRALGDNLRARLRNMPPLPRGDLYEVQYKAILGLERSLAQDRPRALIQMATGSGKTYTACNLIYRLIKHAGASRILFLVDRNNLGRQTLAEFQRFRTPDDRRLFTELYNVQHMQSNKLDSVSKVCITTIQRLFSMLRGEADYEAGNEENSTFLLGETPDRPVEVSYNSTLPIETFDFIVTDECHRSIYNLWRQVLEYFDASIIGLTATPSKQTFGFFNQNLVMEYPYERSVADGVNVDFFVYRISTSISEHGSTVEAKQWIDTRDRETRQVRWRKLDEDLTYSASQLDRDVVAPDQLRTIIRTFRDKLFTDIFPGRTDVPKTLIFAKDDSHADDIVQIVREEFGKGNEFCEKFTYRTGAVRNVAPDGAVTYSGGGNVDALLQSFRNSYHPRIAVTVDMIATGTDVKPIEIVMFLRTVRSRILFEQMKGRGCRRIDTDDLKSATPDADAKTHFVIVDAVGVCEQPFADSKPLDKKPGVSFKKLLESVARGSRQPDTLSSIASRLARLDRRLTPEDRAGVEQLAGEPVSAITARIVDALDPDRHSEAARQETGNPDPPPEAIAAAAKRLLEDAAKPLAANPDLRQRLVAVKKSYEQIIDTVSKDELLVAGYSEQAREKARETVTSFRRFIEEHKNEILALQVLYSKPYNQRLTYTDLKDLAEAIKKPPQGWTPDSLWRAYETLDKSKVRGSGQRILTDIVALVRFALDQDDTLSPFAESIDRRYQLWLATQAANGREFTPEQREWLNLIKEHIAASLTIEPDDFDLSPFAQKGGMGRAVQLFGPKLPGLLDELNQELVA